MSLVQLPFPVWFQVEFKTRVAAFPESALRSAGLVGTRASPPPAPCPAGLQPWPPCEYGDCRGRGDPPRAPGHADRETAARGQGDSRPPDGYGYDGAAGSAAPACVSGSLSSLVAVCVCVCEALPQNSDTWLGWGAPSYLRVWGLAQRGSSL